LLFGSSERQASQSESACG